MKIDGKLKTKQEELEGKKDKLSSPFGKQKE